MLSLALRDGTTPQTLLDVVQTPEQLAEFTHYRHEIALAHRPLTPIASYPEASPPVSMETLQDWAGSPAFRAAQEVFGAYPDRSLCHPIDRMLLYHLVRALRPENVIEIGTYFAAGAEVLARGLWENGGGTLHTIDPFGQIRGPALISRWDDQLQRHVRFYPWTSMDLFRRLAEHNASIDMAFIDGNHDFEYALFDLQSSARFIRPGGVIVLDDANQSGPFWAAKVFLEQNPGWTELGNCIERAEADPFGPLPSLFPGSKFLLLQAPQKVVVGSLPYTTGPVRFHGRQLEGIQLEMPPDQHGEILGRVFLRAFPSGESPQQIARTFRLNLAGETTQTVELGSDLRTKYADAPQLPRQSVEIVLLWRPRQGTSVLRLNAAPEGVETVARASARENASRTSSSDSERQSRAA